VIGQGTDGVVLKVGTDLVKKVFSNPIAFQKESQIQNINSPGIARILRVDPQEMAIYYPEYKSIKTVKWTKALLKRFYYQVTDSLCKLLDYGYLYTDVSPNNIMVDSYGNFVLIDFGSLQSITNIEGVYAPDAYIKKFKKVTDYADDDQRKLLNQPSELSAPILFLAETARKLVKDIPLTDRVYEWVVDSYPTPYLFKMYLDNGFVQDDIRYDIKYRVGLLTNEEVPLPKNMEQVYRVYYMRK